MKTTAIETLRLGEFPNLIWVRVHTDEGVVGLGETFFGTEAVEAYIHESAAPYLLGKDPLHIDKHSRDLQPYVGYAAAGAEGRGNSAIDIALWDLEGKRLGVPVLLANVTQQVYQMARAQGLNKQDGSAVVKIFEQMAGVKVKGE